MIFRTHSGHRRKMRGFSLIEVLVSMVILSIMLGVVGEIILRVQRNYLSQQQQIDAQNNARMALDTLVRLIRVAGNDPQRLGLQPIDPDPDGDGQVNSIRLRADWNPGDGDLLDPYEDVAFSTPVPPNDNKLLLIQEGAAAPVDFLDSIDTLTFRYFDRNNIPIADAVAIANPGSIASVDVIIQTFAQVPGSSPISTTFQSSATIRRRE